MIKEVIVTISPEGETKVEVKGHAGPGCSEVTRRLEAALGETVADIKTREYHQSEVRPEYRRQHT